MEGQGALTSLLAGCLVGALIVLSTLASQPPSAGVRFSGQVQSAPSIPCGYGCSSSYGRAYLPAHVQVTLLWIDTSSGTVSFYWSYGQGPWESCGDPGTSGSCTLVSSGGPYYFYATPASGDQLGQLVNYTGFY